jgi:GNAT superfamily N-acetyltransferase
MSQVTVRPLAPADRDAAVHVINTAARWYRDFLPPHELHDPEMTPAQWDDEARRLAWHAYILPEHQHHGIGLRLVEHLERLARRDGAALGVRRIIVGTYAQNHKARGALEKAGYRLSEDPAAVLRAYYAIPEDRLRTSVTYEKPL